MTDLIDRARAKLGREAAGLVKRAVQKLRRLGGGAPKQVVFVAGVQRSGTNMMIDVLDRSLQTDVFSGSDPRAFENYALRQQAVLGALIEASDAPYVVFKALFELDALARLLDVFAPAKAVWIVRRYDDMVNSHLHKWSGCPSAIGQILEDRDSAGFRGRGMSEETRATVADVYHPDMTDASAVALFWWFRNRLFFEQAFDADTRVLPVRYESLVSDPQPEFRRVFAFVGVDFTPRVMRKVFASSIGKDAPPEIEPPVRALCDEMQARFDELIAARA